MNYEWIEIFINWLIRKKYLKLCKFRLKLWNIFNSIIKMIWIRKLYSNIHLSIPDSLAG